MHDRNGLTGEHTRSDPQASLCLGRPRDWLQIESPGFAEGLRFCVAGVGPTACIYARAAGCSSHGRFSAQDGQNRGGEKRAALTGLEATIPPLGGKGVWERLRLEAL